MLLITPQNYKLFRYPRCFRQSLFSLSEQLQAVLRKQQRVLYHIPVKIKPAGAKKGNTGLRRPLEEEYTSTSRT